jgi:hypothetical protein
MQQSNTQVRRQRVAARIKIAANIIETPRDLRRAWTAYKPWIQQAIQTMRQRQEKLKGQDPFPPDHPFPGDQLGDMMFQDSTTKKNRKVKIHIYYEPKGWGGKANQKNVFFNAAQATTPDRLESIWEHEVIHVLDPKLAKGRLTGLHGKHQNIYEDYDVGSTPQQLMQKYKVPYSTVGDVVGQPRKDPKDLSPEEQKLYYSCQVEFEAYSGELVKQWRRDFQNSHPHIKYYMVQAMKRYLTAPYELTDPGHETNLNLPDYPQLYRLAKYWHDQPNLWRKLKQRLYTMLQAAEEQLKRMRYKFKPPVETPIQPKTPATQTSVVMRLLAKYLNNQSKPNNQTFHAPYLDLGDHGLLVNIQRDDNHPPKVSMSVNDDPTEVVLEITTPAEVTKQQRQQCAQEVLKLLTQGQRVLDQMTNPTAKA